MIDMANSNDPQRPDFPFRGLSIGLLAGALVGLGQMQWNKLTGQWMKFPGIYPVFWSLVGLIAGLIVGLTYQTWKEPKRAGFIDGLTIGLMSGALLGFAQIPWYSLTGQGTHYRVVYIVYWSLFGLIAGVIVGFIFWMRKRVRT